MEDTYWKASDELPDAADNTALHAFLLEKHIILTAKLPNLLEEKNYADWNRPNIKINVGRKEIPIYVTLSPMDENGKRITQGKYTEYDKQVYDAICSFYFCKCYTFTVAMVYRAMINETQSGAPSEQSLAEVEASIEAQRRIEVKINAAEQFADWKGKDPSEYKLMFEDKLLNLSLVETVTGGQTVKAYHLEEKPVFYEYAEQAEQLTTIKPELLGIRKIDSHGRFGSRIPNTKNRIAIKGYLLRRMAIMQRDYKKNALPGYKRYKKRQEKEDKPIDKSPVDFLELGNKIAYTKVFERVDMTGQSRSEEKRYKEYMLQCCEYWKAVGFIDGYTEYTSGTKSRKSGIAILFNFTE
ncbi:MAG: hypothetical protein LUH14_07655 [Clostridiaceae bacterium]|nr:hypothetical protein [Clostridiaceae bacterium]